MPIEKYFNISLDEILNDKVGYRPTLLDGQAVSYKLYFPPKELGMFDEMNVYRFPNGSVYIDFLSNNEAPSKELMEFMAYCYSKWGNDKNGRGLPNEKDIELLKAGLFSRLWDSVQIKQCRYPAKPNTVILLRLKIMSASMNEFISNLKNYTDNKENKEIKKATSKIPAEKEHLNERLDKGHLSTSKIIIYACCAFLFPYVAPCIFIIMGFVRFRRNQITRFWEERDANNKIIHRTSFIQAQDEDKKT